MMARDTSKWFMAFVAYEVNRAYCQSLGDESFKPWPEASGRQKETVMDGVKFHLDNPDATPEESHNNWLEKKLNDGWRHGEVSDAVARIHPCMVAWENLPQEQRTKDYLFKAVIDSLS